MSPDLGGLFFLTRLVPQRSDQHKGLHLVFRVWKTSRLHHIIEPVNALAKLTNVAVPLQEFGYFRVAREVNMAHVAQTNNAGERAGAFHAQPVVEHLNLNVCAFDAVITVRNGIHNQLFPCVLRVFSVCDKLGIRTQEGMLLDLAAHKLFRLFGDLQNAAFKHHVLYNVHLRADFSYRALVADKANTGAREEVLGAFTKQQYGSYADNLSTFTRGDEVVVLFQVFNGAFRISDFVDVFLNERQIYVIDGRIWHGRVLVVSLALCIHQPHTVFKVELLRFIAHAIVDLVGLIGVHLRALKNRDYQKVIWLSVSVDALDFLAFRSDGGVAVVYRGTLQFIYVLGVFIDSRNGAVVLNSDNKHTTVGVRKSHEMIGESFWFNTRALAVKLL